MNSSNTINQDGSVSQAAVPVGYVGNPSLAHVSSFVDTAQATQPIDLILWLARISRGKLPRLLLTALAMFRLR